MGKAEDDADDAAGVPSGPIRRPLSIGVRTGGFTAPARSRLPCRRYAPPPVRMGAAPKREHARVRLTLSGPTP